MYNDFTELINNYNVDSVCIKKLSTHSFDYEERFDAYYCVKCNVRLFIEYYVFYDGKRLKYNVLTCDEQIIKNIIK